QNSTHCYCDATQHTPIYHTLSSFLALPRPPSSTLFPYTTLFRSRHGQRERHAEEALEREEQYRAGQQQQTQAYHLRRGAGALRRGAVEHIGCHSTQGERGTQKQRRRVTA